MPELYMQTHEARSAALKLQQVANELQEQSNRLNSSLHYLQSSWQGPGQATFTGEMAHVLHTINWLADNGHTLSRRVQAEVDEWLAVDAQLGGSVLGVPPETSWPHTEETEGNWLDFLRNNLPGPGTQLEFLVGIGAALHLRSMMKVGSTYAGQVIVPGSHLAKKLAGVDEYLTHIRGSNMSRHVATSADSFTLLEFADYADKIAFISFVLDMGPQWIQDGRDYGDRLSALAPALLFDTAFIGGTGLVAGAVGAKGGAFVGGAIGGAIGSVVPVVGTSIGAAAGATIGGVVGGAAASWASDIAVNKLYTESDIRTELIEDSAFLIDTTADTGHDKIKEVLNSAVGSIQNVELPAFISCQFSLT